MLDSLGWIVFCFCVFILKCIFCCMHTPGCTFYWSLLTCIVINVFQWSCFKINWPSHLMFGSLELFVVFVCLFVFVFVFLAFSDTVETFYLTMLLLCVTLNICANLLNILWWYKWLERYESSGLVKVQWIKNEKWTPTMKTLHLVWRFQVKVFKSVKGSVDWFIDFCCIDRSNGKSKHAAAHSLNTQKSANYSVYT